MNNFLSIVWYRVLPPQYGGQKGIAQFNDCLGKRIALTCLCSENNEITEPVSYKVERTLPVSKLQFWNPFVRKKVLAFIRGQKFSHIIIEHPWHAWLGKYKNELGFKFIVHAHNIEHQRLKARNKFWWRLVKKTERNAFDRADYILFKTEQDKETAIKVFGTVPGKCLIVPYGIIERSSPAPNVQTREQVRKELGIAGGQRLILFAGTLSYEPNARAIEAITRHIIPLLQKKNFSFKIIVCGDLPEERKNELNNIRGISAIGFVGNLDHYLQAADCFINPVTTGSGIQTKNIETISNGCNVVATAFASTGMPLYLSNEKIFTAANHDWEAFTENIIAASSFSNPTPQRFYDDYSWSTIIDRLLSHI